MHGSTAPPGLRPWLLAVGAGLFLFWIGASAAADERRSGFADMQPATQALQRDDALNPGFLWVAGGEQAWRQAAGRSGKSCVDCHGDAAVSMRGVAARYPAFDAASQRPVNLAGRINACRSRHQHAEPWPPEHERLLGLQAWVALASRGQPMASADDARLAPWRARGASLFQLRQGQLDLSCAQCHDALAGRHLGGARIPQGHPTGYPLYRLEWQGLGSLQRRLRNCLAGVRAQVPPFDDDDLLALELFLAQRAAGMALDSPAVRP